ARVPGPDPPGARGSQLLESRVDVGDPEGDSVLVRDERLTLLLGIPERECDVRRLDLSFGVVTDRQTQHVPVTGHGAPGVPRRNRHVVDLLDPHHGSEPSLYGA